MEANNIPYQEVERIEDVMPELDVLYMTRVQKERFFNEEDYVRLKDFYILNNQKMKLAKDDMIVMHPLPRVNEISVEVDKDPRAAYFRQVQYGVYARMALILTLAGGKSMLNIGGLHEGFVLDHIEAGKSMEIYKYLNLDKFDCCCSDHQKCTQQQDGQKGHHQDRVPDRSDRSGCSWFYRSQHYGQYHQR